MKHDHSKMAKEVVNGAIVASTVHTGSKLMSNVAKHPVLVFGLGMVTGYLIYKYRKEIISGTTSVVDAGKDFVLQQKENLEDIVAENKE
jgi:hypothetical protein